MTAQDPLRGDARVNAALRAATLYYLQDLTMESIARELNTSRSSVSRLLTFARESGLVDIRVNSPFARVDALAEQIRERFKVTAHIVSTPGVTSELERLEQVAQEAGRLISHHVESSMVIGVAWGSTVSAVSRFLEPVATHSTTIVQLNGAGNVQTSGTEYSGEILRRFGSAFGAQVEPFPVPTFFDDPATRDAMWRERSTRRVLAVQSKMDIALFGLGSPQAEVPGRVYVGGYLSADDFRSLREDGAVGDVATVFYRADGSDDGIRLNARSTGPELARLRRAPRRIGVVSGAGKLQSLHGAIAARLVTDVVLDEPLARSLVENA